jgi:hypothetical protein
MPDVVPDQQPIAQLHNKKSGKQNSRTQDIVQALDISPHLMDRASGLANLLRAYEQWKAYHDTCATIAALVADGTWPRKPNAEDVIEVFVAKSTWYKTYIPAFTPLSNHPALCKWLDETSDAPSGEDIFGIKKPLYTFTDLTDFYARAKVKRGKESDAESLEKVAKKPKNTEKGRKKAEGSKQHRRQ